MITETTPEKILYLVVRNQQGAIVAKTPARDFAADQMTIGLIESNLNTAPHLNVFAFNKRDLKLFIGDFRLTETGVKLHNSGQRTYHCQILK